MVRLLVPTFFALAFIPSISSAVEIKNIRPCYAPFGATRVEAKCLPGDVLFITYDVTGLSADKTGKVSYETTLELLDVKDPQKEKVLFREPTDSAMVPVLGGNRMPGDLHVVMGRKQAPGKYAVRLTITDKLDKNNKTKATAFQYDFVVAAETFGFVNVSAPAVGFPGLPYAAGFTLVNMSLDKKNQPDAEVVVRIIDDKGAKLGEVKWVFPADTPLGTDLTKSNLVPLSYPVYLNRPGRFTIEVLAHDKLGNKKENLRFPVTVLDVNTFVK